MTGPAQLAAALADRYRIERELGAGGMATVYLAEDLKHHRRVAVKVLRSEIAASLGAERFSREVQVAAQLQHPHILPLLDSGEAGGFLYYVMPYIDGESLRERLARVGELPVHDAVKILIEVVDAMAHAHEHDVVHRDIKPDNIMLSGRHALVMDFGVAKAVSEATGRNQLTTAGVALGTPAYMAPEQAAADPHLDHRVDIYAIGVLGYELLTGRPPFTGRSPQEVLAAHVTQSPDPVERYRPGLSPALSQVLMRCLAKRPADRWQTAEELLNQLEPLATPSGGMTPTQTRPVAGLTISGSRRGILTLGGALVLLAILGWVGWRVLAPRPLVIVITNIRQTTREPEPEIHVALSPDGSEVAYQSGYSGHTHIVLRDVTGGRPLPITGDWGSGQTGPRWMPDGREIVFWNAPGSAEHPQGTWKMPRLGGPAQRLDSSDQSKLTGGHIILHRGDSIFARTADGRETFLGNGPLHSSVWRRDGSAVAYVSGNQAYLDTWGNVAPSSIWVTPIDGRPVQITDDTSLNVSPAWLPDGSLLYISNAGGARDLYAVRLGRSGKPREPPSRLTTGLEAYSVSLSSDGRTGAYDRFTLRRNILAVPIPSAGVVSLREAEAVTTGNQIVEVFGLSRDGKLLVFDSNLEGKQDIFMQPVAGGEARKLSRSPGDNFAPNLSPDGKEIAFYSIRNGSRDIYVMNADGSNERQLTSDPDQSYRPTFSPDGLSLAYYNLGPPSSSWMLHRDSIGAPWGPPRQLTSNTGFPRWSPDGSRLVTSGSDPSTSDGSAVIVQPLVGSPRVVITSSNSGLARLNYPTWSQDGRWIYFRAVGKDGVEGVYQVAESGGAPRLLVRFDDPSQSVYAAAPLASDGKFYFAVGEIESDIYLMDLRLGK